MREYIIKIKNIKIVLSENTDTIFIYPDLPTTFPEMKYEASLKLDARKGYGKEYCRNNFPGVPLEIINTKINKKIHLEERKIINPVGDNAYYSCQKCGLELQGEEVGTVAAGETYANGPHAPCPECEEINFIDRDEEEY